jgi:hypothetical protein
LEGNCARAGNDRGQMMGGLLADGARKHSLRSTANGSVGSENKERRGSAQLTAPRNAETMDATSLIETPGGG